MSEFSYDYNPTKKPDYRSNPISVDKLYEWTQEHMYRTSYGNHWTDKPKDPISVAPPGYLGFVPEIKSNNKFAQSYTPITQEVYSNPTLGRNTFKLSSTGFNHAKHDFIDPSLTGSSHKYGKQTIQNFHPAWKETQVETISQSTYKDPQAQTNPTYRETDQFLQTSNPQTKNSGFQQNHTQFDGTGWKPHPILDGQRDLTEYRVRYNQEVPFHRDTTLYQVRKMATKETNLPYT